MIEAWIVTRIYEDNSKGVPLLFHEEPDNYHYYIPDYIVERIAYLPLESKE